jgi:hypothetical protein
MRMKKRGWLSSTTAAATARDESPRTASVRREVAVMDTGFLNLPDSAAV